MAGTTADIIPIVIVPVVALAFWLVMMYHADSHPRWGSETPADTVSTHALEDSVPAQHLSSPGPVVPGQSPGTAVGEVTPEQARARSRQWGRILPDCSGPEKVYLKDLYDEQDEEKLQRTEDWGLKRARLTYIICLVLFVACQLAWRAHRSGPFQRDLVFRDLLHAALLATFFVAAAMSCTFSFGKGYRLTVGALVYSIIRFTTVGIALGAAGAFWGAVYAGMLTWSLGPAKTSLGNHIAADLTNGAIAGTFIACAYVALNISPFALALGAKHLRYPHPRWPL